MFFISDKAVIKGNDTAILRYNSPTSTLTNLSDYPAILMGSDDNISYQKIVQLEKGQSQTLSIIHKYIKVLGDNSIIYVYNHLPDPKSNFVSENKPSTITDTVSLQNVELFNASGTKTVAILVKQTEK